MTPIVIRRVMQALLHTVPAGADPAARPIRMVRVFLSSPGLGDNLDWG
jgi:hypothetical protein